jgi:hypothetical protein
MEFHPEIMLSFLALYVFMVRQVISSLRSAKGRNGVFGAVHAFHDKLGKALGPRLPCAAVLRQTMNKGTQG